MIGCGDVTERKSAPAYQLTEGFSLDMVMSRSPGKAEDYARRHGIPRFTDNAQTLINDPDIDAIYVATPPDSHHQLVLDIARAGKICCVEKPMSVNHAQCVEMQTAFEQAKLPLFAASPTHRFHSRHP